LQGSEVADLVRQTLQFVVADLQLRQVFLQSERKRERDGKGRISHHHHGRHHHIIDTSSPPHINHHHTSSPHVNTTMSSP
jgi:hypothetical protein